MSIVSNSNHWLFISSTGGLSAGRKNSNYALFPYYTDDKITESSDHTGSKTIFLVTKSESTFYGSHFLRVKIIYTRQLVIFIRIHTETKLFLKRLITI